MIDEQDELTQETEESQELQLNNEEQNDSISYSVYSLSGYSTTRRTVTYAIHSL